MATSDPKTPTPDQPDQTKEANTQSRTQEEILEQIIEDHDLEYTQALRVIVSELDLRDEAIRHAVEQLLRERNQATDRPRCGLIESSEAQEKIIRAFRRKIHYHALQTRMEWIESELRWAEHQVQMSELSVIEAMEAEEMPQKSCVVDPFKMVLHQMPFDPNEEMLRLAVQLAKSEEYRLETIANEELLPSAMQERAQRISQEIALDAEAFIVELAAALLSLQPENRSRVVQAACMSGELQDPPTEDPPPAVRKLEELRLEVEGGLDEIWAGANPKSIESNEKDLLDIDDLDKYFRDRDSFS